jgi:PAS domain S-box-containing protein
MKIPTRLMLLFLVVAVLPLAVFSYFSLQQDEVTLRAEVLSKMSNLADKKAIQVKSYLAERVQDVRFLVRGPRVMGAIGILPGEYAAGRRAMGRYVREDALTRQYFERYVEETGLFYDVFLITPEGEVVYSQKHKADFATSLLTGTYRDTQLAQAFRNVRMTLEPVISGYELYGPSQMPSLFIAAPIMVEGKFKGIFAVQLGSELFNRVATDATGLGLSGEVLFARRDGDGALYTTPLKHRADAAMKLKLGLQELKKLPMFGALAGESGAGVKPDYRGKPVVAAWRYLPELDWGMVVKVDTDEVFAPIYQQRALLLKAQFGLLLFAGLIAYYFGRQISVPLDRLARAADELAKGNLNQRAEEFAPGELGLFARVFNRMAENLQGLNRALEDRIEERTRELSVSNEHLQESETRLRELFESMSSGVAVYRVSADGQDFVFSGLNRAAEKLENLRREDLLGKNVTEVFPGIAELGLLDVFKRVYNTGLAERYPVSFYQDGRISGWRDNFVYKLPGGEIVAIYDDVTERMQAQQALAELNRDFVTLLESTSDFIYLKDKNSRIRFCSQSMARITGHQSWREMVGKHDLEIFPPETAKIYYEEELPIFRDGVPLLNKTDPYLDEQGNRGWVSTNKWPVFGAEGKTVVGLFGISRDITEYKRAEIALRESEQRFRNMFHKHSSIMLLVEPDSGNIVDANAAAASFYGYPEDRLRGMQINQINMLSSEEIGVERHLALEEKRNYFIFKHRRANGEIRVVEVYSTPISDGGRTLLFSIVHDITERKEMEDALQRSNADLERFAYSVSHDMRQPLRAVSGHLQLLQHSLKEKLDEDERENLGFALEGARRMDSMIVSLLDYSRVGRKTEEKQWIASRASLDEALGFLTPLITDTKAEVNLNGEWPQVFASRDELTRLFQNLIGNAIKFREPQQAALVDIDSLVHGDTWRVSVRDHGVGIDPQQIDRLFQFFSRLQSRSRFEGTGMGLALCRRIVEHHQGRIWVESEGEGKGSTFIFEMPMLPDAGQK